MGENAYVEDLDYHPLSVTVGDVQHRFALHKYQNEWRVTDVHSGLLVSKVHGYLQGMPVSASAGFTLRQIRHFAQLQVLQTAARIGAESFNSMVQAATSCQASEPVPAPDGGHNRESVLRTTH